MRCRKHRMLQILIVAISSVFGLVPLQAADSSDERTVQPGDWPMWRCDAGRTGVSDLQLPSQMQLQWTRQLPAVEPAYRNSRLQFDAGYEPIAAGGLLIVGSSANDSVTAYEAATGRCRWQFFTEGPVRFAPAAWKDRVFVGSDDGCLYCLSLDQGQLLWKRRAVPDTRKVLGNRRLISVWPIRGGPVVADGRVYFAAGVFPFEGVFVYALDAATGDVIWRNDRLGFLYGPQPHNTEALAGLAPQGYLVVDGDQLAVPCGSAYPAILSRETGELISFQLPSAGRQPGGWFAAVDPKTAQDMRRGLVLDRDINQQLHEDKLYIGQGQPGVQASISIGTRSFDLTQSYPGVEGGVHSILAAKERLFVVTKDGVIHCFGPDRTTPLSHVAERLDDGPRDGSPARDAANRLIQAAGNRQGYALICGLTEEWVQDGGLAAALARESDYHVIAVDSDADRIDRLRHRLDAMGLYGRRISLLVGRAGALGLPPYFVSLLATEDVSDALPLPLNCLRPYGGACCILPEQMSDASAETIADGVDQNLYDVTDSPVLTIRRTGPLPGATDYTGNWQPNQDALVRAPLGLLWFDDTVAHFKRSPQPHFLEGIMVSYFKDWRYPRDPTAKGLDYPLNGPVLSDVYTGRVLAEDEAGELRSTLEEPVPGQREPNQYRPPQQTNDWSPDPPRAGSRLNPLTGVEEPRTFPKQYGCDGGFDYGYLYTMRSATAAFYDKTNESGTINIAGPRSGCTNSVIPACGVLNVPYFYEGCTCSYPLPTGLALVSMPEIFEQWTAWGQSVPADIQRIGINFGAPGDRVTRGGTLWLDVPSIGGPSPEIPASMEPADAQSHYEHSVWYRAGDGWPWVNSSSAEGLSSFKLRGLQPGNYTVRLCFAERADMAIGQRVQDVRLQSDLVLENFDIMEAAGESHRGIVYTLTQVTSKGEIEVELSARSGKTLISGIELVRDGIEVESLPSLP